jgi:hypothetical protein
MVQLDASEHNHQLKKQKITINANTKLEENFPRKKKVVYLPLIFLFLCFTWYDSRVRFGAFGLAMVMMK